MAKLIEVETDGEEKATEHKCLKGQPFFISLFNYCPVCGEPLSKEIRRTIKECSACHFPIIPSLYQTNYCPGCGVKFEVN